MELNSKRQCEQLQSNMMLKMLHFRGSDLGFGAWVQSGTFRECESLLGQTSSYDRGRVAMLFGIILKDSTTIKWLWGVALKTLRYVLVSWREQSGLSLCNPHFWEWLAVAHETAFSAELKTGTATARAMFLKAANTASSSPPQPYRTACKSEFIMRLCLQHRSVRLYFHLQGKGFLTAYPLV